MTVDSHRQVLKTEVAWAGWDEHEYRGHRVFTDLAGTTSLSGLFAVSISGRRLSPEDERVLDDVAVCCAVADPRIWPLKLARLVASYGSSMAGFCAAHVMLEGAIVGGWNLQGASEMLRELSDEVGDRLDDDAHVAACSAALVARTRRLIGFGVPFRPHDERIVAFSRCLEKCGRSDRRYWRLLQALAAVAKAQRSLEVNMIAAAAAAVLDLGFKPHEASPMMVMLLANCILSNALEGAAQRAPILRELPASLVRYVGRPPRAVSRTAT